MEIQTLLQTQKASIEHYFSMIDPAQIEHIVSIIDAVPGTVYFTGVGKSGFICQKIAATLVSIGIKAAFLSPIDALHGDIGIVEKTDLVVLLSKSGETEELLKLIPFIHARGAETMAWTCANNARLAQEATTSIELPLDRELCSFNLAPTTSALLQLLFGDALAMALMERKKVTKEKYYLNHPSGSIGKKISVRVDDIMIKGGDIPTLTKAASLKAAILMLTKTRKGCVLITDGGQKIEGIFTDGDVKRVLQTEEKGVLDKSIGDLMTKTFISIPQGITAWEAVQIMQQNPEKWVNVAPVTKQNLLVGLLTMHDILRQGIR